MARWSETIGGGEGFRVLLVRRDGSPNYHIEVKRKVAGTTTRTWKRELTSLGTVDLAMARASAHSLMAALLKKAPELVKRVPRGRPAAPLARPEEGTGVLTLGRVVALYRESAKFKGLAPKTQGQYDLAYAVLLDFVDPRTGLGWRAMDATLLDQDKLDAFTQARLDGTYAHPRVRDGEAGATTVRNYFVGLKAACTWAYQTKDLRGKRILPEKVFDGLKLPVEKNLRQPIMEGEWLDQLLALAERWPHNKAGTRHFKLVLLMAEAFGNRINGILHVQWTDIDWARAELTWNPEYDKMEQGRTVPIPVEVLAELRWHFEHAERPADVPWVFWARIAAGEPISYETARAWLIDAFPLALGIDKPKFLGYHALRRKWKTDRADLPLKAVMEAGGWKSASSALRYDKPSRAAIAAVIEHGRGNTRGAVVTNVVTPFEKRAEEMRQVPLKHRVRA